MIQNPLNYLTIPSRSSILNKFNEFHPSNLQRIPMMALTKADIIESVHQQLGFPKKKSNEVVEQLIETIKSTLATGEDVLVSGFGKFCVNDKKERRGRNPATGDSMMLRPRRVVTFKCSGKLREKVNGH
jgi:integration host factor subunit alpha